MSDSGCSTLFMNLQQTMNQINSVITTNDKEPDVQLIHHGLIQLLEFKGCRMLLIIL